MGYIIRNNVPKIIYGKYISPYNGGIASRNNCSTRVIVSSLRTKIVTGGGTIGSLKCIATYLDTNFTTSSKAECTTMSLRVKIEAGGGVAGNLSCIQDYLTLNFYD
jgi:hypothetical protein